VKKKNYCTMCGWEIAYEGICPLCSSVPISEKDGSPVSPEPGCVMTMIELRGRISSRIEWEEKTQRKGERARGFVSGLREVEAYYTESFDSVWAACRKHEEQRTNAMREGIQKTYFRGLEEGSSWVLAILTGRIR
jgi:hypothetical protein